MTETEQRPTPDEDQERRLIDDLELTADQASDVTGGSDLSKLPGKRKPPTLA